MTKYYIPALLFGCCAYPVAAQSAPDKDSNFNGPRVEIIGGYDTLKNGSDVDIATADPFDADGPDQSVDGFAYGIAAGYDFDLGNFVVGAEAEFMDSTGKQGSEEIINAPFDYQINLSRDFYLGARAGYKLTPSTLIYAKGGYTSTRVESVFEDQLEDDGIDYTLDDAQSIEGFRIGAGVEHSLGKNLFGPGTSAYTKLEYRYSNYSDLDYNDTILSNREFDIDLDRHQVLAGVGIRF